MFKALRRRRWFEAIQREVDAGNLLRVESDVAVDVQITPRGDKERQRLLALFDSFPGYE